MDRHTFHVPEKHIVKGSIPWLPASQHEGLSFVINPEAGPQEQMIVNLGSTQRTCQPGTTPGAPDMLDSACAEAGSDSETKYQENFRPEKVYPHEGITFQWEYRVKVGDGKFHTVAACSGSSAEAGSCLSIESYKDLVYSVWVRDDNVHRLPEIWAKVRQMLASWEKRS